MHISNKGCIFAKELNKQIKLSAMETNLYSKNDLLLFHITGGGGNNKKLTCEGIDKITDCVVWGYLFQEENGLFDSSGNKLMSKKELETALRTGEGRLEIDGYYNTYYTEKLGNISLEEFKAMDFYYQKIYLSVVKDIDTYLIDRYDLDINRLFEEGYYPIEVDKKDYHVKKMLTGYYGIYENTFYECVFGGDSACDDHYNEEYVESVYDDWDGVLYWKDKYEYQIDIEK